jgi:hypothetical protein
LRKAETFSAPDGYRFTSHRVVRHGEGKRIATFGQPNRFFWISAPTLHSAQRLDVLPNRLAEFSSDRLSTARYLRREGSDESVTIKALEASKDGSGTVFAVGSDRMFFVAPDSEKAEGLRFSEFPLPFPPDFSGESQKETFACRTTHLNYVR